MASDMQMLSVVIWQLLIWFFLAASFRVCVYGHPTSFCSIIDSYTPLIYHLQKYEFFSLWC